MTAYRILVVDDDLAHRDVVGTYLRAAGFEVEQAEDGVAALSALKATTTDLLVMDVQMPGMDGLEVLRQLREHPSLRDLPVICVSSLNRTHVKVRCLELGAQDYMTKPFEPAELLARIRVGLRQAARYQRLEGAMVGDLQEVGLDGLLQTLQIGMRNATLRLTDVGAELVVERGQLRACRFRRMEGLAALARVLLLARGRFAVQFHTATQSSSESAALPLVHALMDAMVSVDEARQALGAAAGDNPLLSAAAPRGQLEWLDEVRAALPLRALDLVATLPGALPENARSVAQALARGELAAAY